MALRVRMQREDLVAVGLLGTGSWQGLLYDRRGVDSAWRQFETPAGNQRKLATGERGELLPSVMSGARSEREKSAPSEGAALVVVHGLFDFLARVHDERAVLHHRLFQGSSGEH